MQDPGLTRAKRMLRISFRLTRLSFKRTRLRKRQMVHLAMHLSSEANCLLKAYRPWWREPGERRLDPTSQTLV